VLQAIQRSRLTRKLATENFSCVAGNSKEPPDEKTGNGQLLCYKQFKTAIRRENRQRTTFFVLQAIQNSHWTRKLAMDNSFCVAGNLKQQFNEKIGTG
jgi:hypothetical protein